MKFELVEFYPVGKNPQKKLNKNFLGTVHLYFIEEKFDLRGIKVVLRSKSIYFLTPHMWGWDEDEQKIVHYPVFRFTDENKHKEFMDFLHNEVKPIIKERLASLKSNNSASDDPTHQPQNKVAQK